MQADKSTHVWDLGVRLFHWSLGAAVLLAYVSEDEWMDLHLAAGLAVLGLLSWRLIWGVIGSEHARFADFARAPARVMTYLTDVIRLRAPRHLGHNPAGGLMVLVLMTWLLAQCLSGLLTWAAIGGYLPLGDASLSAIEGLHDWLGGLLPLLILLHLLGVLVASLEHRENLVRAMLTGNKRR